MESWALPIIDMDRCTGCGYCAAYCPTSAVAMVAQHPVIVRPEQCAYCGICEELCPAGAVTLTYEITSGPA